MRGSPIQNFICVLALLLVMAAGIHLTTRQAPSTAPTPIEKPEQATGQTKVVVRMIFSHPPEKVTLLQAASSSSAKNIQPINNQIDVPLTLPEEEITEFLIDIQWPEQEDAHYFTKIIIRQDGKDDDVIVLTSPYSTFSDTFSIDTRTPKK